MGYLLTIDGRYKTMSWYGYGPEEAYVDRHDGVKLGIYSGPVEEQFVNYVYPQDNGNKYGCRWAQLTEERNGIGVYSKEGLIQTSAMHYTQENLTAGRGRKPAGADPRHRVADRQPDLPDRKPQLRTARRWTSTCSRRSPAGFRLPCARFETGGRAPRTLGSSPCPKPVNIDTKMVGSAIFLPVHPRANP